MPSATPARRRLPLRGRVALITGSSRGIGRETARLFAEKGAAVVLNGRERRRLIETQREMARLGLTTAAVAGDVSQEAQRIVRFAREQFGRLDILINNAGASMRGQFCDTTPEMFQKMITANLLSAASATYAALPELRARRGSILYISSISGLCGFPGVVAYSVAKMGLTALREGLAAELAANGLHVGIIYVGFTQNDPDKTILNGRGETIRLERRFVQTQRTVARHILRMIVRRQSRKVLTIAGGAVAAARRWCPGLLEFVLQRSHGGIHGGTITDK